MVYCTKCGSGNEENATVCDNCKDSLNVLSAERKLEVKPTCCNRVEHSGWGGASFGFLIGIIVLLIGFSLLVRQLYGVSMPWLELVMFFFGVYLVMRALRMKRRR